ncbi:hypothetical protein BWR15_06215 [Pseudomonas sp. T]|nr:hypothetical protein BWR15_06215 [Pseudomonas sp. T]
MLNGSPLNRHALNAAQRKTGQVKPPVVVLPPDPVEPGVIPSGYDYRWHVVVTLGGAQVSGRLTGRMDIDREEGAAGVATFALYYPPGVDVPLDLDSVPVAIDFTCETGGETRQERRYTGFAIEPAWDVSNRLMTITCSDQLQYRVENMTIEQIDQLTGGWWSADVFEAVDGRSRWDYAQERLSTRAVSMDVSATGEVRVSSWYAPAPAVVFGPGSTIYQSIQTDLAKSQQATNRVELVVEYRYSRLWQRDEGYTWTHPGTMGHVGVGGFCSWRPESTELPDVAMIEQATESAGLTTVAPQYYRLPPSSGDPCGTGQSWSNKYPDLLLGADWTGSRRWVQSVTETYNLVIATDKGRGPEGGRIVARQNTGFEIEDDQADTWEEQTITQPLAQVIDLRDDARRDAALACSIQRAVSTVVGGQRGTTVSWKVPTPMGLGIDLQHGLELGDQLQVGGKVRRIVDEYDFDAGSAVTTLSIAVMRGGGTSDAFDPPAKPLVPAESTHVGHPALATQLGMRNESPIYNDDLDGFAGNYDNRDDDINASLEEFPRRMTITASEIPAALRDELKVAVAAEYRVGIPNDKLVL